MQDFLDARYITAPEACWRLFEFPLLAKAHVVERLPVHLQNEQDIIFHDEEKERAVQKQASKDTKLDAWLKLNLKEYQFAIQCSK